VSRLVNTALDARELLEAVMLDFGLDRAAASRTCCGISRNSWSTSGRPGGWRCWSSTKRRT
jgi:hypothetical protein